MAKAKASLLQLTSADVFVWSEVSRLSQRYFRVAVLSVMQCETAWCYVAPVYHPCATLAPANVTRLNRTQYSTTAISSETQSYSIEFVAPHVMKAGRRGNV